MAVVPSLNKVYDFKTIAPGILNLDYKNQKVIGILNAQTAKKYYDIVTLHSKMLKVVTSLPSSYTDLSYLLLENSTREKTVLALEYIDLDTVVEIVKKKVRIDIEDANIEDVNMIRKYLLELGYNNLTITTI